MPSFDTISSLTFATLCIVSALPFIGIPFPTRSAAEYYAKKNEWLSTLTNHRLTPIRAGYCGALLRVCVGLGVLNPPTRTGVLLANCVIVVNGTVAARRDGRPMGPQWGMLGAMIWCLGVRWMGW